MAKKLTKKQIAWEKTLETIKELESTRVLALKRKRRILEVLSKEYEDIIPKIQQYIKGISNFDVDIRAGIVETTTKDVVEDGIEIILPYSYKEDADGETINLKYYIDISKSDIDKVINAENISVEKAVMKLLLLSIGTDNCVVSADFDNKDIKFKNYLLSKGCNLFNNQYLLENDSLYEVYENNQKQLIFDLIDIAEIGYHEEYIAIIVSNLKFVFDADGVHEQQLTEKDLCHCNICNFSRKNGMHFNYAV